MWATWESSRDNPSKIIWILISRAVVFHFFSPKITWRRSDRGKRQRSNNNASKRVGEKEKIKVIWRLINWIDWGGLLASLSATSLTSHQRKKPSHYLAMIIVIIYCTINNTHVSCMHPGELRRGTVWCRFAAYKNYSIFFLNVQPFFKSRSAESASVK